MSRYYKTKRAFDALDSLPDFINKTTDSVIYKLINIPNIELDRVRYDMKEAYENINPMSSNLGLPPCVWEIEVPYGTELSTSATEATLHEFTLGDFTIPESPNTPIEWIPYNDIDLSEYCDINYVSPLYYTTADGDILSVDEGYIGLTESSSWFDQSIHYFTMDSTSNEITILQTRSLPFNNQNLESQEDEWMTLDSNNQYTINKDAVQNVKIIATSTQTTLVEGAHYNFVSLDKRTIEIYNPYITSSLVVEYEYAPASRLHSITQIQDSHSILRGTYNDAIHYMTEGDNNRRVIAVPGKGKTTVLPDNSGYLDEELLLIKENFVNRQEEVSGYVDLEKWTSISIDEDTMFPIQQHEYAGQTFDIYMKVIQLNSREGKFNHVQGFTYQNDPENSEVYNLTLKSGYLYSRGSDNWGSTSYNWYGIVDDHPYEAGRTSVVMIPGSQEVSGNVLTSSNLDKVAAYGKLMIPVTGENKVVFLATTNWAFNHLAINYDKRLLLSSDGSSENYTYHANNKLIRTDEVYTSEGSEFNYYTFKVFSDFDGESQIDIPGAKNENGSDKDGYGVTPELHTAKFVRAELNAGSSPSTHRSIAYYPYEKHIEEDHFAQTMFSLNTLTPLDSIWNPQATGAYLELYNFVTGSIENRISLDGETETSDVYKYPICIRRYQEHMYIIYRYTFEAAGSNSDDTYSVRRINVHTLQEETLFNWAAPETGLNFHSFAINSKHEFVLFGTKTYKISPDFNYLFRFINTAPEDINNPTEYVWFREQDAVPAGYEITQRITEQSVDHWGRVLGAERWDKESLKDYRKRLIKIASSRADTNKQGAVDGISAYLGIDSYRVNTPNNFALDTPLSKISETIASTVVDTDGEGWHETIDLPTVYNDLGTNLIEKLGKDFDPSYWEIVNVSGELVDSSFKVNRTANPSNHSVLLQTSQLGKDTLSSNYGSIFTSSYLEISFEIENYISGEVYVKMGQPFWNNTGNMSTYNRTASVSGNGKYSEIIFSGNGEQAGVSLDTDFRALHIMCTASEEDTVLDIKNIRIRKVTNPYKSLAGHSNLKIVDYYTREEIEPLELHLQNSSSATPEQYTTITIKKDEVDSSLPTYTSRPYLVTYNPPIQKITLDGKNYEGDTVPYLFSRDPVLPYMGYGYNFLIAQHTTMLNPWVHQMNLEDTASSYIYEVKFKPESKYTPGDPTSNKKVLVGWYNHGLLEESGGGFVCFWRPKQETDPDSEHYEGITLQINYVDESNTVKAYTFVELTKEEFEWDRYNIVRFEIHWSGDHESNKFAMQISYNCTDTLENYTGDSLYNSPSSHSDYIRPGIHPYCSNTGGQTWYANVFDHEWTDGEGIIGGIGLNDPGGTNYSNSEASIAWVKSFYGIAEEPLGEGHYLVNRVNSWYSDVALEDESSTSGVFKEFVLVNDTANPHEEGVWEPTSTLPDHSPEPRLKGINEYPFKITKVHYSLGEGLGRFDTQEEGVSVWNDNTYYSLSSRDHELILEYYYQQNSDPQNPYRLQHLLNTTSLTWESADTTVDEDQIDIIDIMEEVQKSGDIPEQYKGHVEDLSSNLSFKWNDFNWDKYRWQDGENIKTGLPTYYDAVSERGGTCSDPIYLNETDCIYASQTWSSSSDYKFSSGSSSNSLNYVENLDSDYIRLSSGNFYYRDKKYYLYPEIPSYELVLGGPHSMTGMPEVTGPISARINQDQLLAFEGISGYNSLAGGCQAAIWGTIWNGTNKIINGGMEIGDENSIDNWILDGAVTVQREETSAELHPQQPFSEGWYSYTVTFDGGTDLNAALRSSPFSISNDKHYRVNIIYNALTADVLHATVWDSSAFSPTLILDPEFDTDAGQNDDNGYWETSGLGVSITGGKAVFTSVGSGGNRNLINDTYGDFEPGKTYQIEFEIENYISGSINPHITGAFSGNVNGDGVKTSTIVATSTNNDVVLVAEQGFVGEIKYVTVKEVGYQLWDPIPLPTTGGVQGQYSFIFPASSDSSTVEIRLTNSFNAVYTYIIHDVEFRDSQQGSDIQLSLESQADCTSYGRCNYDPSNNYGDEVYLEGITEAECTLLQTQLGITTDWVVYNWEDGTALSEVEEGPLSKEIYSGYSKRMRLLRPISNIKNFKYTGTDETLIEMYNEYQTPDVDVKNDSVLSGIDSWKHYFSIDDTDESDYPVLNTGVSDTFDLLYSESLNTYTDTDIKLNHHIDAHNKLFVAGSVGTSISAITITADRQFYTSDDKEIAIKVTLLDNELAGVTDHEIGLLIDPIEVNEASLPPIHLPSLVTNSTGEVTSLIDISSYSNNDLLIKVTASIAGADAVSAETTLTYIEDI